MSQKFIQAGYEIEKFEKKSDIYVINTCTVTNMSEKKSRQIIRKAKELNKDAILIVVGCYAQVAKEELKKMKEIDIILGNNEKNDIIKYVNEFIKNKEKESVTTDVLKQMDYLEFGNILYTEKTRAVIKIQDGCDRYCSYCIIPIARGRVRSRKPENIIEEIENISKKGIKEVVITGIHIASYGKDFKEKFGLIELLEKINDIKGIERIRLGSIEPTIITEEFVNRIGKLEKICNHFHLSLQSGCDETLKRMNRRYNIEEFKKGVSLLREKYKNVALTTDIIVGFPGETDKEFNETYEFLKEIKFYKMHVFKYSPRKGTKAAEMKEQIDGNIKEKRSNILIDLSNKNEKEFLDNYINKKVKVLFEQKDEGYTKGHSTNYMLIKTKQKVEINSIQEVEIQERENLELISK